MSEELKQAISALQCAKRGHCDHAMADEAIAALEALTQRPAAQAGEAFESVLIDGVAYDLQAPVAAELLRLHLELQALPTQLAQNDAFFVLDDEAKAMIVNSHHYTPENIRALIEQLKSFADPTKTNQADWDNLDWRGFCNVLWRVMMGLSCDLPTQPAAQEMPDAVEHYGTVDDLPAAQATPEPVDWKPIKTSKGGREAVRNFFRSTLKRHDFDDYITGALAADFACVLGGYLQAMNTAATPEPVGEVPIWNSIQIASWIGSQLMHEPAMFERAAVCKFVRSLGRHPTLLKHSPKDHVPAPGVPEGWRDAFDLAAQMLTWGRDEGLTPEQVNEVDAHAKLMFAMLAAQAKGGDK